MKRKIIAESAELPRCFLKIKIEKEISITLQLYIYKRKKKERKARERVNIYYPLGLILLEKLIEKI